MKFIRNVHFFSIAVFLILVFGCQYKNHIRSTLIKGNAYYVAEEGNDEGIGNKSQPWRSIDKLNKIQLRPGDTVFFQSDKTFSGSLFLGKADAGSKKNPVILTSFGNSSAVIDGGNVTALTINNGSFIKVNHLHFIGSGRKKGNEKDGVVITNSTNIEIDSVDVSGFQKAGLLIYDSHNIEVKNVYAHENGFAGVFISGDKSKASCSDIHISGCAAINNPGDPTNLKSHSGNGILAGYCKNVMIEYCSATNNGWDMPRIGNGPVGIWAYEADSVIIQKCISYNNKTSVGGEDGGGYDFDGGVTNSIIQQCLSYDNQGSAFGIFQYEGATGWDHNIIRNNISLNDGNVSRAGASAFIWNGSKDINDFKNLEFYNNLLYNSQGAVITYDNKESDHTGFRFYNNIFIGKDELVKGKQTIGADVFFGNDWWSLSSGFNMNGVKDFKTWANQSGKEQLNGKIVGFNINPKFDNASYVKLTSPWQLKSFFDLYTSGNSKLKKNLPVYK